MSVSNASQNGDAEPVQEVVRAVPLLEEALAIIDQHAHVADIGARLQAVIDALKARTS